jgi:phosphoribosyl 1,2-cyclic phosphodiesterase
MMRITVWGSRGSVASAGPDTIRYGGNTVCVQVDGSDGYVLLLDAGTGIRRAGLELAGDGRPVHVLLTHLHMDHIQGLGFFRPLFEPGREVHIWGPPSTTHDLRARLTKYLSPPLFPVRIRDLVSHVEFHDVPTEPWTVGDFAITAAGIVHPGPTVGYRIENHDTRIAYMPDHEPILGGTLATPEWLSGYGLARGVDVLLHDGQYTEEEYRQRVGWGHSSISHAVRLADLAGVRELLLIHHDPDHSDGMIDQLVANAEKLRQEGIVRGASEGMVLEASGTDRRSKPH